MAISPQLPDQSLSLTEKENLEFEVLSDTGNAVAKNFGLVFTLPEELQKIYRQFGIDLEKSNGVASFELPIPATYIINRNGVIQYAFINANYTERLEPSEIVEILKGMQG